LLQQLFFEINFYSFFINLKVRGGAGIYYFYSLEKNLEIAPRSTRRID